MAIIVTTAMPNKLLSSITAGTEDGTVRTWSRDSDGDFTHSTEQWNKKAWFRPRVAAGQLILNIFPPRDQVLSSVIYAVYHGRFIEMILSHFDRQFSRAVATAMPQAPDRTKG
jgi:hypothetical protein